MTTTTSWGRALPACKEIMLRYLACVNVAKDIRPGGRLDVEARAREKQRLRDADEQALRAGLVRREELRWQNGHFARPNFVVDLRSSKRG